MVSTLPVVDARTERGAQLTMQIIDLLDDGVQVFTDDHLKTISNYVEILQLQMRQTKS